MTFCHIKDPCGYVRIALNQDAMRRRARRSAPPPKPVVARRYRRASTVVTKSSEGAPAASATNEENEMHTTTTEAVPATEYRATTPTPFAFPVDDDELARVFEQAARDAAAAETRATEAEQRAAAARDAFRAHPSGDAHGLAATSEQLAENARDRAQQTAERAAVLGAEQRRRLTVARLRELEPVASRDRLLSAAMDVASTLAREVHALMAQASKRLIELLAEQNAAAREANRLATDLGMWRHDLRPVPLADVNRSLFTSVPTAFPARCFNLSHGEFVRGPVGFTVDFGSGFDGGVVAQVAAVEYLDVGEPCRP
jgi:hypothetical protein